MKINKNLFGRGSIFLFANILNAAIPFFLLPILTRVLTPEDYGVVTMFTIFLSFTNNFVGLSVHGAINVQYFKLERQRFEQYVTNCLILLVGSAAGTLMVVALLGGYFEKFIGLPYKWMLIAVITSFFQFLITIRLTIWVVMGFAKKYGTLQISQAFINSTLSLVLILLNGMLWEGRILGQTITIIIFGCIAFYLINKSGYITKPKNIKNDIKNALLFGLPLIPHSLGAFFIHSTDRLMISSMLDVSSVGIYMVGLQLGQAMGLLSDSFNKIYSPWIMKNLSSENLNKFNLIKASYISMGAFLVIGVAWALVAIIALPLLVGEKFSAVKSVVMIMCIAHVFTGFYYIVTNYIFYSEKTKILAFITFITAIINFPLTYYLLNFFGIEGAAMAFLISQFLFFAITWWLSNKVYPMPWFYFIKKEKYA